jgi:tetratricopeptide (TPR) repeat protein
VEKFITERAIFYFINNLLEKWEILNPVVENPLDIALEGLKKAIEIDVKAKKTKDIAEQLNRLKGFYVSEGSNAYAFKMYDQAFKSFNTVIMIGLMPQLNHKDTVIYYYAGLSAQLAGKNTEAIDLYKKAIELGYSSDGNAYFNIDEAYKATGDNNTGLQYLEDGFIKYPKNQNVMFSLINHYLTKGDDPTKILGLIDNAINEEPTNASLHFAKGTLYDKLGQMDNAIASYIKATEINPQYFDAYYNIGALYFNKGAKQVEEANKLPAREIDKYDALMLKANVEFKNSLPYMIKAYEVTPTDKNTIEALKNIYFRFRTESEEMNAKYLEYNEKLKTL